MNLKMKFRFNKAMHFVTLILVLVCAAGLIAVSSTKVWAGQAQSTSSPSNALPSPLSADEQQRLELATRMHEIWPMRTRVESALDSIAQGFPEERRSEVKARLRQSIQYDLLQEESVKAMADIFTAEELQKMIDFYGSDVGKTVSAKTADYELLMRPALIRMLDKAMLDLRLGETPAAP
jgi:hypothetical protein